MNIRHYLGWVVLLFTSAPASGATGVADCENWAAKIVSVQGNVESKRIKSDQWSVAKLNDTYCPGDRLRIGDKSRAGIVLANETLIRLDQNTAVTITRIEKELPSLLHIIKGIAHFISRVPRSLKVNTPFVNAAIEGTEFVVNVTDKATAVTVFEGSILAQNNYGAARITNGETIIAKARLAPVKVLLAKPRDTVQWALYFPPIIQSEQSELSNASRLLHAGRVEEAQKLLKNINGGEARALESIIAVVGNDKERAFQLATDAVQQTPQSAASHIAMSYAWQAKLDLKQALASAQQAVNHEHHNAIAWARLAELQLSFDKLNDALDSAKQATQINAKLSRTQSILGYAYLLQIKIDEATAAFDKAIELDQVDPLPRLGLGLAKIRKNQLAEGRREIEIAVLLDPNNGLFRSYLGKAYFEEKRGPLDATQFEMSKLLDPNDPTPFYYDAIRKQTINRPVEGLEDLNKSIELNDNRAVYRSTLQLDQDEATRNISLARIYNELGFEQAGLNEATKSLQQSPSNHSAHRFLADIYGERHRHEIARVSELFQSQMLQPLNQNPLPAQAADVDLEIINVANSFTSGLSEYSSLFTRDRLIAQLDLFAGNQNTKGGDLIVSGLYNNFSFSAAHYSYESDGFRENNDVKHNINNVFLQYQVLNNLSIQAEYRNRDTEKGDLALRFDPDDFAANERNEIDTETGRLGFHHRTSNSQHILGSFIYQSRQAEKQTSTTTTFPFTVTQTKTDNDKSTSRAVELQHILQKEKFNITSGITYTDVNKSILLTKHTFAVFPPINRFESTQDYFDKFHGTLYTYVNYDVNNYLNLNVGVSYDVFNNESVNTKINRANPKLGALVRITDNTLLRLASFSLINRPIPASQTLEPTQIAGFNQFYDDLNGTKITQHNLALEQKVNNKFKFGIESSYRDLGAPVFSSGKVSFDDLKELSHRIYFDWVLSEISSLSITGIYEEFENLNANTLTITPTNIKTKYVPVNLKFYWPGGIKTAVSVTYVDQDYTDIKHNFNHDSFWIADLFLGYKFPDRIGSLIFGVHNLFDEEFNFYELNYIGETNEPRYQPARSFVIQLNLTLS